MIIAEAIVDFHALLELIYVALIAGVGICAVYAAAVVGLTRTNEHRRAGRRRPAALYGALAAIAIAVCVWATVMGVTIMATK